MQLVYDRMNNHLGIFKNSGTEVNIQFVQVHDIIKVANLLFNKATCPKTFENYFINMCGKAVF